MSKSETTLSQQQTTLLDNMIRDMGHHGDWCFYVVAGQDAEIYGGYIPAMVFRGVKSWFSMNGPAYGDIPFIIDQNVDEARQTCRQMNLYIGLSDDIVDDIIESAGLYND